MTQAAYQVSSCRGSLSLLACPRALPPHLQPPQLVLRRRQSGTGLGARRALRLQLLLQRKVERPRFSGILARRRRLGPQPVGHRIALRTTGDGRVLASYQECQAASCFWRRD